MTNCFTTLAAAAALFGLSAPAAAEMVPFRTIGHWTISSSARLCDASGKFDNGTSLDFTIGSSGVSLITVQDPKWRIPNGSYEVVMQVDRAPAQTFAATGEGGFVMWPIPLTGESINLLSYGRTLRVTLGQTVVSYDLALSGAAWNAVVKCAGPKMAAANPFAGSPPSARAETPANPFAETASNPYRRM